MTRYRVHAYVTMRIPVDVQATSPAAAARKGLDLALTSARLDPWPHNAEYAEDYEDFLVVDKLDRKGQRVRSWEIKP